MNNNTYRYMRTWGLQSSNFSTALTPSNLTVSQWDWAWSKKKSWLRCVYMFVGKKDEDNYLLFK